MRKNKLRIRVTPELLQAGAAREAPRIAAYGWRPSRHDLAQLKASTGDARAYRALAKAWRRAGFRLSAIQKFAGRAPANRNATIRHFAAAQMEVEN